MSRMRNRAHSHMQGASVEDIFSLSPSPSPPVGLLLLFTLFFSWGSLSKSLTIACRGPSIGPFSRSSPNRTGCDDEYKPQNRHDGPKKAAKSLLSSFLSILLDCRTHHSPGLRSKVITTCVWLCLALCLPLSLTCFFFSRLRPARERPVSSQ